MNYTASLTVKKITLGGISVGYNPTSNHLIVFNIEKIDAFGKKLKFKEGDEILIFNNRKLTIENIKEVLGGYLETAKAGDRLEIEVLRKDKKGNEKTKTLKAKVKPVKVTETDVLEVNDNSSSQQIQARKEWLGIH
jgi:hypothetical protein